MSFFAPAPSPDGKRIYAIGFQPLGELLRYDLRSQRLEPYLSGISAEQPDFSRDGKWIAYVLFPEGTLWRSRVDGSERLQLTTPPLITFLPSWSPDGKRIAFTGIPPATGGIPAGHFRTYVVSAEGGNPEMVLTDEDDELNPTSTPDGNSLIVGGSPQSHRRGFQRLTCGRAEFQ
jgi:Tol biopolymer transport system component